MKFNYLNGGGFNIKIGTWNILADGLSHGEFLSDEGDAEVTRFEKRWPRIGEICVNMFSEGLDVLSTQENDHPEWLLQYIRTKLGKT